MESPESPCRDRWYKTPTKLEWFVIAILVVGLAVLLFAPRQWASSGRMLVPVRVVVFDAATHKPIQGASVRIVRCQASLEEVAGNGPQKVSASDFSEPTDLRLTDADGAAVVPVEFTTGASHKNPQSKLHTDFYWISVSTNGFGKALLPIRHEPINRKWMSEQTFLPVYVGMSQHDNLNP